MSEPTFTDWRQDALVELEDIGRRVRALKEVIAQDVKRDDEIFARIMAEVKRRNLEQQEDAEFAANMGAPCHDPSPGLETRTHAFAALQESAGIVSDHDEPPSRTIV